ncbi:MAG: MATE family efflux transporter [Butyricicoccaceae bacterium]
MTLITAFANLFDWAVLRCARWRAAKATKAQGIMVNAGFMLLLSGAVLTVLGIAFHRPLLYLFGASEVTYLCVLVIVIYLIGTLCVMLSLGLNPYINCQALPEPAATVALGAAANIVLDPFYLRTAPRRARRCYRDRAVAVSVCCMGCQVFNRQKSRVKAGFPRFRPDWHCIQRITVLGIASFVMSFTDTLVQVACNATLRNFGGDLYISVMTVLNSVRQIAQTPVLAIADGASTAISYNYGARLYRRTRDAIRFMTQIAIGYTMLVWILVSLFPALFIRIFNQDAELVAAAVPALHIYFFGFVMMAFQYSGQSTFRALGRAKYAVFFSLLRKAFIVVPLTLLLPYCWNLGVSGVFAAEPVSNCIGGLACYFTMRHVVMPELKMEN